MHSLRSLCRPLAAALTLSVCLSPTLAAAAPGQTDDAPSAAVAAPSPYSLEGSPTRSYQEAAAQLSELGLSAADIRTLWERLGPELTQLLSDGALSGRAIQCLLLPHCRVELLDRYLACAQSNPGLPVDEVVTWVNMGLDADFYDQSQQVADPGDPLVLVNKYNCLPSGYAPEVVPLEAQYGSGSLTAQTAAAFAEMAQAAQAEGITLRSVSAYRSYSTQAGLYSRYLAQGSRQWVDTFSARAGYSEHQTGLALDINTASTSAHFENTAEYAWLQANCARFGFILRYPEGKEHITGYRFEPWHYRYVGVEIAQLCMEQSLTYEEYTARLPVPGAYQVPGLYWNGTRLELGSDALLLDGVPYLSATLLAAELGWSSDSWAGCLILSNGQHSLFLLPGRYSLRDGVPLRLTAPAVTLDGELYLSLGDLCQLLDITSASTSLGIELTPSALL